MAAEALNSGAEQTDWSRVLTATGAVSNTLFGVQYDLNAAWRKVPGEEPDAPPVSASFCDHNCLGQYDCPAARTLNVGIMPSTLTPAEVVIDSFRTISDGFEITRHNFFEAGEDGGESPFEEYCRRFMIPSDVAEDMRRAMDKPGFEVNLFGGNPELHKGTPAILGALGRAGQQVHLTTTGGRFMHGKAFLDEVLANPPSRIALSADDFAGAEDIRELANLPLPELRARWSALHRDDGQRRKAHEAVYTAKLAQQTKDFPPLMFNMVVHRDNLAQIDDIIDALVESFPGVLINPLPAQSAFSGEAPALGPEHADRFRDFIDRVITAQSTALRPEGPDHPFVPRLHYWLMLRSVFDLTGDDKAKAAEMLTGQDLWTCYRESPAGFYVQVGLGPEGEVRSSAEEHPGGHLGCFWNRKTVTLGMPKVWSPDMTPQTIAGYVEQGKPALGAAAENPCAGCAFPRLVGHLISTEMGMDPRLLPHYLARRKQTLGF